MTTPIRIVPMRGPTGLIGAPQVKAPSTASFTYRGGPLLTAVEVVTVFWGATSNEALNAFFQFLVSGPYVDQLREYSTPQQKIGRGRYAGTARVTNPAPGTSVTDNAVQQMLEGEVASKYLPAPTANTLYFPFQPPCFKTTAGRE